MKFPKRSKMCYTHACVSTEAARESEREREEKSSISVQWPQFLESRKKRVKREKKNKSTHTHADQSFSPFGCIGILLGRRARNFTADVMN